MSNITSAAATGLPRRSILTGIAATAALTVTGPGTGAHAAEVADAPLLDLERRFLAFKPEFDEAWTEATEINQQTVDTARTIYGGPFLPDGQTTDKTRWLAAWKEANRRFAERAKRSDDRVELNCERRDAFFAEAIALTATTPRGLLVKVRISWVNGRDFEPDDEVGLSIFNDLAAMANDEGLQA